MKKPLLLILISFLLANISFAQNYQSAESVEYDPVNQQWLASNGSSIIADDGNGNLSFFTGSATHGMEVLGNILYAIDQNTIRAYDLTLEAQVGMLNIPGVVFLNGITNDGGTNIYVTDFGASKIYKVDVSDFNNMTYEEIVSNTGGTPNGVVYDGDNNRLLYVLWGGNASIRAVDLSDNSVSTIVTTNLGNIDGIDEDNDGNYYISSWSPSGQISKFDKDFANPLEVVTTPFINNPADIGYSLETDTLAIPVGNNVVFVGFEQDSTTSTTLLDPNEIAFNIYPNPVSQASYISFDLKNQSEVSLEILDLNGMTTRQLLNGVQQAGSHKVLFAGHQLPQGLYFCRIRIDNRAVTQQLIVH